MTASVLYLDYFSACGEIFINFKEQNIILQSRICCIFYVAIPRVLG